MTNQTVVTGLSWMNMGVRSVQSALKDLLLGANQEILLCAYSVTGGADEILEELENSLKRGVQLKGVFNRFYHQNPEIQEYFLYLVSNYSYCQIYNFNHPHQELHSKLIVVDRQISLIGSANLSLRGMKYNYELGVIVNGTEVITISKCFDNLLTFPFVSIINNQSE